MKKQMLLFSCIAIIVLAFSCKDEDDGTGGNDPDECTALAASFETDIMPIIQVTCAIPDCHVSGFDSGDFTTYEGLKAKVDDETLEPAVTNKTMPPVATVGPSNLTDLEIETINCWISDGAEDN